MIEERAEHDSAQKREFQARTLVTGRTWARCSKSMSERRLEEFVRGQIWLAEYPIRYAGARFNARMTVIRLADGGLVIHSPCAFEPGLTEEVRALGDVKAIIAPGDYHYFHVASCQRVFPDAATFICPGVEKKVPDLEFTDVLDDAAPALWSEEISQVVVRGTAHIREVVFLHRPSKTLVVTDLVENFGNQTPGTNWVLRSWFRMLRMWNRAAPAPEYWLHWGDKATVRDCLERILAWEFERVVLAHGDLVVEDAKRVVERAWQRRLPA